MKAEYDLSKKNPNETITQDEYEHLEEMMSLKNKSRPAQTVDFGRAVRAVAQELDALYP